MVVGEGLLVEIFSDSFQNVFNRLLVPRTRQIHVCLSIERWSGFIQQFLFVAYRIFDIFTIRYVI